MKTYLVVILNTDYLQDFLIIVAESADDAKNKIQSLGRVQDVISVWQEAE